MVSTGWAVTTLEPVKSGRERPLSEDLLSFESLVGSGTFEGMLGREEGQRANNMIESVLLLTKEPRPKQGKRLTWCGNFIIFKC